MFAKIHSAPRAVGCFIGAALFIGYAPNAGAATSGKEADAFPNFESYIKVSGSAASINGDEAAFQKRTQMPADGGAGIEDLHVAKDLTKSVTAQLDGRALVGSEDYLAHLKIEKNEVGAVDVGYKKFRTFYDGIGGFFPLNREWLPLSNEELHTDRGRFWAEAKLEMPDKPVLTLRYTNETRTGRKDSLTWGDTNLTGLPTVPTNNATRKIVPAYLQMDEHRQILEGIVTHTIGKTAVTLRAAGDWVNNNDSRFFTRYPGEVTPNPERINYQRDGIKTDTYSLVATTETPFTEKTIFHTGLSYEHVKGSMNGERPNAIGVLPTFDFKNLVGSSHGDVYTANASLEYRPTPTWLIQPAVRGEDNYIKAVGSFIRTTTTGTPPVAVDSLYLEDSRIKDHIVTPELNVRYTGFKNLALYSVVSDRIVSGDNRHTTQYNTPVPTAAQLISEDVDQSQTHATLGANWNESNRITLRSEIFHKEHENKFIGYAAELGNRFVLGYQFTGLKLTAIVRPIPQLSFTSRYQPQWGQMQVTTESTAKFDSMEARSHLIGETIDWNPNTALYVQLNANVVFNYIQTAYPRDQAPMTIAPQRNSDNNYWTSSVISGFVVDKDTDAQLQATYQRADNYDPSIAVGTQPYGAGYEEYTVSAGLKHKFADKWVVSGKVGYFSSRNDTTGGYTNYHGPQLYLSFEHAL